MRTPLALVLALLTAWPCAAQNDGKAAHIDVEGDVFSSQAIGWLDGVRQAHGRSNLAGLVLRDGQKLEVLLNPALRGSGTGVLAPSAFVRPDAPPLDEDVARALGEPPPGGSASTLYTKLGQLVDPFLGLPSVLYHEAERLDSLEACIQYDRDGRPRPNFVVLAVDVQVSGVEGQADAFEVLLTLRLFRVEVDHRRELDASAGPPRVERLELLWSDRGSGRATLGKMPTGTPRDRSKWGKSDQDTWRNLVRDAFGVAVIDALRNGPGLNLFVNPRMLEADWFGTRSGPLGPSLHDVAEVR
ncbi:MAG: hypothetical protein H6825_06515 [Planctomycetes bacterium]|nr:hypothetical protein [Planctomycetota bacterium]